jgi:hypothetical protein
MPQPRKPVEVLGLSGTFRPDRHGQRRVAPKSPHPIGDPPPSLAADEAGCWREFVSNAPAGVLTAGDRWALEALARLHAKSRRPEGLLAAEMGHLRALLGEMGATPGRQRPSGAGRRRPSGSGKRPGSPRRRPRARRRGCAWRWRKPGGRSGDVG